VNPAKNNIWKNKLFILALAIASLFVVLLIAWQFRGLKLVKTMPVDASTNVENKPVIVFEFNKPMAANYTPRGEDESSPQNVIELEPYVDGDVTVKDSQVIFTPKNNLRPYTKYVATLVNAKPKLGRGSANYTITFTTGQGKFSDQDPDSPRNKFIRSLPYTTSAYSIDYVVADDVFVIQILAAPVEANKQAALDFISSQGVELQPEQVNFYVIPFLGNTSGP
jgi:hypothetical protein